MQQTNQIKQIKPQRNQSQTTLLNTINNQKKTNTIPETTHNQNTFQLTQSNTIPKTNKIQPTKIPNKPSSSRKPKLPKTSN